MEKKIEKLKTQESLQKCLLKVKNPLKVLKTYRKRCCRKQRL